MPGLHLRVPLQRARYHMQSGEVQVDELGQLENALAEAVMRHELTVIDPTAADPEHLRLTDILDRFPVDDDGRRVRSTAERVEDDREDRRHVHLHTDCWVACPIPVPCGVQSMAALGVGRQRTRPRRPAATGGGRAGLTSL